MNLEDLKNDLILKELNIEKDFYGRIAIIIDFGNVNYWFEEDKQTYDFIRLKDNEKIQIDLELLKNFCDIISDNTRIYYGIKEEKNSLYFIQKMQNVFNKRKVFTKRVQKIKHYLTTEDKKLNTRQMFTDKIGKEYVFIDKCNFDVEISVDAIKIINEYDTICLFSGDADFVHLLRYLKNKGKKIILIKGGNVVKELKDISNQVINAQQIKKYITRIKVKT